VETKTPLGGSKGATPAPEEKGMTEAEKMRQRIMQRKAEAAGSPSTSSGGGGGGETEAERMRQRIAAKSGGASGLSSSPSEQEMDDLIEKRRAESRAQSKVDAQNERDTIISNFMANAKTKKNKFKPKLVQLKVIF